MAAQSRDEKKYRAARMAQKRLEHRFEMIDFAYDLNDEVEKLKDALGRVPLPEIEMSRDEDQAA